MKPTKKCWTATILGFAATAIGLSFSSSSVYGNTTWKMPWRSTDTAKVNQGRHIDGYGLNAFDFGLAGGKDVLAPIDSTVISQCNAGNNHRAIKLKASTGQIYDLIHVTTADIFNGKTYKQGDKIGTVATDKPWNSCAKSYGPHLHMGFPGLPMTIDGYTFSSTSYPTGDLRSTNGIAFVNGSRTMSISTTAVNLKVCASNLSGRRVYVQMWRNSAYGYPPREWNYNLVASSGCITFSDLDGAGNTFAAVDYYTVASLNPIASGQAAKQRTSCYTATGGTQLCDKIRR